jgi:hypothetical protein
LGGAILIPSGGGLELTGCTISDNVSAQGNTVEVRDGFFNSYDTTFSGNTPNDYDQTPTNYPDLPPLRMSNWIPYSWDPSEGPVMMPNTSTTVAATVTPNTPTTVTAATTVTTTTTAVTSQPDSPNQPESAPALVVSVLQSPSSSGNSADSTSVQLPVNPPSNSGQSLLNNIYLLAPINGVHGNSAADSDVSLDTTSSLGA